MDNVVVVQQIRVLLLKEWPKQPIMVGEVGEIPIEFTSKQFFEYL